MKSNSQLNSYEKYLTELFNKEAEQRDAFRRAFAKADLLSPNIMYIRELLYQLDRQIRKGDAGLIGKEDLPSHIKTIKEKVKELNDYISLVNTRESSLLYYETEKTVKKITERKL